MQCLEDFRRGEDSVSLACFKTPSSRHSGILFKHNGYILLFHFAWHKQLSIDDNFDTETYLKGAIVNPYYFSSKSIIGKDNAKSLIGEMIYRWKKSANEIKYSTYYDDLTYIKKGGDIIHHDKSVGFTCASFIANFLNSLGFQLVDYSDWKMDYKEDSEWKADTINHLLKYAYKHYKELNEEIYDHLKNEMTLPVVARIKPEQLVSAGYKDELPAGYEFCKTHGDILYRELCKP